MANMYYCTLHSEHTHRLKNGPNRAHYLVQDTWPSTPKIERATRSFLIKQGDITLNDSAIDSNKIATCDICMAEIRQRTREIASGRYICNIGIS